MPKAIRLYVRYVEAANRFIGRIVMYMIFVMIGVLLYSSISRAAFDVPLNWVVEISQFMLAAYYLMGGAYSLQLDSHVRMDLVYSRWSPRKKAVVDCFTILFLVFYLVFLLLGGISSSEYALQYDQRNYTAWGPRMAPIKIIMTVGIFLMLLQAIAIFFKDLARARGKEIA